MQTGPTVCDTFFVLAFESLRFQLSTQDNEEFFKRSVDKLLFSLGRVFGRFSVHDRQTC